MKDPLILVPLKAAHIDDGIPGDCTACPVLLALNDADVFPSAVQPDGIWDYVGDEDDPKPDLEHLVRNVRLDDEVRRRGPVRTADDRTGA